MPQRMRVSSYQLGKRSLIQCMKTEWSIVQYSVLLPCTSVCPPAHLQFGPSQPRHKNVCLNLCCKSCLCTKLPFEWIQVTYQACLKSWISFFFAVGGRSQSIQRAICMAKEQQIVNIRSFYGLPLLAALKPTPPPSLLCNMSKYEINISEI